MPKFKEGVAWSEYQEKLLRELLFSIKVWSLKQTEETHDLVITALNNYEGVNEHSVITLPPRYLKYIEKEVKFAERVEDKTPKVIVRRKEV